MKRKLCYIMSAVLALSICMPGGALQALADDGGNAAADGSDGSAAVAVESDQPEAPSEVSQGSADSGQAGDDPDNASTIVEGETQGAVDSNDSEQSVPNEADNNAASDENPNAAEAADSLTEEEAAAASPEAAAKAKKTRGTPKEVPATVTNLTIQTLSGNTVNEMWVTDRFYLAMKWDASQNGADLHESDYFDIKLPDQMVFPSDSSAVDFNLYGDDGTTVIATAHVTPGPGNKGGSVRVTFTDWVEGKENVKGDIRLAARFDQTQVTVGEENTFQIQVGSEVVPVTVTVTGPTELKDEVLSKWGQGVDDATGAPVPNVAEWHIRINHMKATLTNVVITDHLSEGAGDETYIADSFLLRRVEMSPTGSVLQVYEVVDLTGKLTVAADGKSFTLNLGNISGDQYRLSYRTTYTPGTKLRNNMTLTSVEQTKTYSSSHQSASSGGQGTGDLANKIKIIKVDAEDNTIQLPNAEFEVTRPDGTTFPLTTGPDGTVTSGTLTSGTYKVKEKTAPTGYELNGEEFTLTVSSAGGAVQTITDEPTKISVGITKKWVGPEGGAVTVHLLADGEDTGKTLTLSSDNGWTGSFDGLRQYAPDGTAIAYFVSEDPVGNYSPEITGSVTDGFTITNTNTEKVSIPVTKTWVGPAGSEITVGLLADGNDTGKTVTLNEGNDWSDSFAGLPKYNADGSEIAYTVTEAEVSGADASKYTTAVTGDAVSGFTITNTNKETVGVSGTKAWDDDGNRDGARPSSITVRLLADGTEVDFTTVTADDSWAYSFSGLAKYDSTDGHEIAYTVTEDAVPNYATTIDGTDIVNSYTPGKTSITVTKTWNDTNDQDGIRTDSVKVQLYADGEPTGNAVELDADNQWTHTWTDLSQKAGGQDIAYTVEEVEAPEGYAATVSGDATVGFTVTNTHTPETVSIPVTKKWVGGEGGTVTVHLLADGADTGQTLQLSKDGSWKGSFDGLPKRAAGKEIAYTVTEDAVEGYTSAITGNAASGFTVTNTKDGTPGKPGKSSGKSGLGSSLAKTGDGAMPPVTLLAAALAGAAVTLLARRRMLSTAGRGTAAHARHQKR